MKIIESDYIIAGGGMAGLSLAYYLVSSEKLNKRRIVVIDREKKEKNDRTWCFWQKEHTAFEHILCKKWDTVYFGNQNGVLRPLEMGGYSYKMLRGIDFYQFIYQKLAEYPNVSFVYDTIETIDSDLTNARVFCSSHKIIGEYVFDSTYQLQIIRHLEKSTTLTAQHNLLQHFKGLVIKTTEPVFDVEKPQLMNFAIEQHNECRFMYVLPISDDTALIEFTLFTDRLLTEEIYNRELRYFIEKDLKITDYAVLEEEFGVIPMSDEALNETPQHRIIRIGTAGGSTNPATGYTFANTQKRLEQLVKQLELTGRPYSKINWFQKRHQLYASILLNVLSKKRYSAAKFFDELYKKNTPEKVFKFLDNKTTFWEEIRIMSSTPILIFLRATLDVLYFKAKRFLDF